MKITSSIHTIPHFLTQKECDYFIHFSEDEGYKEATISFPNNPQMIKSIRNNDRVTFESSELAESLFEKMKPSLENILPEALPHSLNPRFRFYRYTPGQRFKRHVDGSIKLDGIDSRVTFMIYLNDDCAGGETIFRERGRPIGGHDEHIIKPDTGMGLLFEHRLWHEGAPVLSGSKYVLRTDVFYKTENT